MQYDPITMFCCTDLCEQVRGKGFATRQIEKRLMGGIGWMPNNLMNTSLGTIAPGVWGTHGDVMLMPNPATGVEVDFGGGTAAEHFYLCDVQNIDGTPWDCCPRILLRDAAAEFLAKTGLVMKAIFEHEFIYSGANSLTGNNYVLDAVRRHEVFGETYLDALKAAGVEVDSYLAEFGPGQFEVTVPPQEVVQACDTAVIVKEMAHATAHRLGHGVTFSPRVDPEGLGSGVHIHVSLWDQSCHPVSHNPARPHGLGVAAGQFLSGVVRHMPALCAFNAPSCRTCGRGTMGGSSTSARNWHTRASRG